MDSSEGKSEDPGTLHKYLYCQANPANAIDPSGFESIVSVNFTMALMSQMTTFELRGARAALTGARTLFGSDGGVDSIIYGLDIIAAVDETVGNVALGVAAVSGGMRMFSIIKNVLTGPMVSQFAIRAVQNLKNILPRSGVVGGMGDCGAHAIANALAWAGKVESTMPITRLTLGVIRDVLGGTWQNLKASTPDQVKTLLAIKLRAKGELSQAVVHIKYPGASKDGHVLNAFYMNGEVKLIDTSPSATGRFLEGGIDYDVLIIP